MKLSAIIIGLFVATALQPATAKKTGDNTLTLLYWNIQNGMWDGQTDDYQRFTDWVSRQQPDICVWCEAQKLYVTNTDKSEKETEEERRRTGPSSCVILHCNRHRSAVGSDHHGIQGSEHRVHENIHEGKTGGVWKIE